MEKHSHEKGSCVGNDKEKTTLMILTETTRFLSSNDISESLNREKHLILLWREDWREDWKQKYISTEAASEETMKRIKE